MKRLQSSGKGKGQQKQYLDGQSQYAKARTINGVVSRLLMRCTLDTSGKLRGNFAAVTHDMGDLSPCQDQAKHDHQGKSGQK